ncbi:hypothetical protein PHSC3_000138 [Chlamydiales bacterium STE3]|nr:hypothetical protein PHSC3_000138 [Chlamydiales bacterium STE3]
MNQRFFKNISMFLAGIAGCLCFATLALTLFFGSDLTKRNVQATRRLLPGNAFTQKQEAYVSIKEPVLFLQFSPPKLRLPDLRSLLVYYGKNGRPDVSAESLKLHFAFNGLKATQSFSPGERVYLTYDKKMAPCKYNFSPYNQETNLWFEAVPEGQGVSLSIGMRDENNEVLFEPQNFARFFLQEKEFTRLSVGQAWELGKWRVDGTLLARQKARWLGPDRFLEKHGGNEYAELIGRQKINFDEGEESYSIFVKPGDCLIWDEDHWVVKEPGIDSVGMPLMCVKKVDERIMNLELWDVEGKSKVVLNLIRTHDNTPTNHLAQEFKFVGARTRTQCVFQINQKRMMVKPNDWLLLTDSGWKKLNTVEEIDDYVNCRLTGTLFVLDDIIRKDERSHLVGTMFNPARTDMQVVEIAMQHNSPLPNLKEQIMPPHGEQKMHAAYSNSRFSHMNASNLSTLQKERHRMPASTLNVPNINPLANH